jgi:hypothetical protein
MDDEWSSRMARIAEVRRQEAIAEETRREAHAAREQLWHREVILAEYKRLGMEPRYCGSELITPWLIAAVKKR